MSWSGHPRSSKEKNIIIIIIGLKEKNIASTSWEKQNYFAWYTLWLTNVTHTILPLISTTLKSINGLDFDTSQNVNKGVGNECTNSMIQNKISSYFWEQNSG